MTETLLFALVLVPCLIVAIVFHEVAHGWVALRLGDTTARDLNRLSLNPLRHVDPVGTLIVPGALALFGGPIFGWAKPVPVRRDKLDNPRYGMMAVAAAGPGTNLVLAFIGAILLGIVAATSEYWLFGEFIASALGTFILINAFLALFNLLPIPPFDGSHIVEGLLPRSLAKHWQQLQAIGMLLLVLLIAMTWLFPDNSVIANVVYPPVLWVQERYFEIAQVVTNLLS